MKKMLIALFVAILVLTGTGCKRQAWSTTIRSGNWTLLETNKGEVIYDGPEEYVDEEYERDALTDSEFNWIWNSDKGDFDKIERGSCKFTE